jgi:hypothetical protein
MGCYREQNSVSLSYEILIEWISLRIMEPNSFSKESIPKLFVISNPDEIKAPQGLEFSEKTMKILNNADYNENFVIFLNRGQDEGSGMVEKIERLDKEIRITAKSIEPDEMHYVLRDYSQPYQVVIISKDGTWNDMFHLKVLRDGEGVTVEIDHFFGR